MTAADLQALAHDYWEFSLREFPNLAHDVGDPRYGEELFHESIADHSRRDAEAARLLARLAELPVATLGGADVMTARLLGRELGEARERYAFGSHLRPELFPLGPEGSLGHAMQKTTLLRPSDAEQFVARLETVPQFFDDHCERLRAGLAAGYRLPAVLLARIRASVSGYVGAPLETQACYRPLAAAAACDPAAFGALATQGQALVETRIVPAMGRWLEALSDDYARSCRDSIGIREEPDGEAYYAFLARHFTTKSLTPAEIHATGLEEVARIRAEMEAVAARAGFPGDLAGLREHVSSDARFAARDKEDLRERMEVLAKRIERRIPEFFGRIPRMTYGVDSIPEALAAQLPPAYAQPNPPSGTSAGVFWVTSLPERCRSYLHVPFALHEAWPGHLMHIALLQEMTELPAFRRYGIANYTAYVEGWAMYCEKLGHDLGFYADPFAHYGALDMEIWRAVRLVVDTGIHAFGWTRDRAIQYMGEQVALPRATIEAEIDRYIGWPGQALGYKIGELTVSGLRAEATRRLGERLDLRALHDRFSDAGPVTLDLLETHVREWIAAAAATPH